MSTRAVTISINGVDNVSKVFTDVSKNSKSFSKTVSKSFKTIVKSTAALTAGFGAISAATVKLAEKGGKIEGVSKGFQKNFENSEESLNDLRQASLGAISDFDLMLSANFKAACLTFNLLISFSNPLGFSSSSFLISFSISLSATIFSLTDLPFLDK